MQLFPRKLKKIEKSVTLFQRMLKTTLKFISKINMLTIWKKHLLKIPSKFATL